MEGLKGRLLGLEKKANLHEAFCSVGRMISELDAETKEILERVLRGSASTRSIWVELQDAGYTVDRGLLAMHRQGKCACPAKESA